MKNWNNLLLLSIGVVLLFSLNSCSDLSVPPPSQVEAGDYFKTDKQIISTIGAAYTNLSIMGQPGYAGSISGYSYAGGNILAANEWASDEMVAPQRGSDWFDGGLYIRAHRHNWTTRDQYINNTWTYLFSGISTCNRLISQLNDLIDKESITENKAGKFISELKVLRSLYYFWLMDMYGNVPIVTDFKNVEKSPSNNLDFQTGRTNLFKFLIKQINDNIDKLSTNVDQSTYGRVTKWSAYFLKAKIYLNANVYLGTRQFSQANLDSVVASCNAIINSGNFHMAADYFDNFKPKNSASPEFILAIPFDHTYLEGYRMAANTLHYLNQSTFDLKFQPYNGYAMPENFYNSFQSSDLRKKGLLQGYQKGSDGSYLIDNSAFQGAPHGDTLFFTAHINELEPGAWRKAGVRFNKFMIKPGSTVNQDNDFPIFRYTDVLLMKAEALWRMDSGSPKALELVNKVRERAGLSNYSLIDAQKILYERGHELYTELWRRQDLVRFDGGLHYKYDSNGAIVSKYKAGDTAFNDAWWEKAVDTDTHVNVFPIPFNQIQTNKNLNQNPGY